MSWNIIKSRPKPALKLHKKLETILHLIGALQLENFIIGLKALCPWNQQVLIIYDVLFFATNKHLLPLAKGRAKIHQG